MTQRSSSIDQTRTAALRVVSASLHSASLKARRMHLVTSVGTRSHRKGAIILPVRKEDWPIKF